MVSKKGEPLFKRFTVKVWDVGNTRPQTRSFCAPRGKGYSDDDMHHVLEQLGEDLDRRLPNEEYGLVQIAPNRFSLVWRRNRENAVRFAGSEAEVSQLKEMMA